MLADAIRTGSSYIPQGVAFLVLALGVLAGLAAGFGLGWLQASGRQRRDG